MTHHVRHMTGDDLPQVERIYNSHSGEPLPPQWSEIVLNSLKNGPAGAALAWVATNEADEIIGYIIGEVRSWEFGSKPAGWVTGLGVEPKYQGKGTAEALLRSLLASFIARDMTTIRTMVVRDDLRVLRFFRSSGFTIGPYTEFEMELKGRDP